MTVTKCEYQDLLEAAAQSSAVHALISAALRAFDVDNEDKTNEATNRLIEALRGIETLAKAASDNAFRRIDECNFAITS